MTLEPVMLGSLVAFSWAGVAIGLAAFVAFMVRTPLKLVLVDWRRHRMLPRTHLALRIAVVELVVLGLLAAGALWLAGPGWLVPVGVAVPLVAVELWFDVRSRSRRLVPELAGSVGIAAVVASITIAGDGGVRLAMALWLVLAARAVASIPYVRTQILRTRRGSARLAGTDGFQLAGVAIVVVAVAVDSAMLLAAVAVGAIAVAQSVAMRRPSIAPVKVIGVRQMLLGVTVVAAAAIGAAL